VYQLIGTNIFIDNVAIGLGAWGCRGRLQRGIAAVVRGGVAMIVVGLLLQRTCVSRQSKRSNNCAHTLVNTGRGRFFDDDEAFASMWRSPSVGSTWKRGFVLRVIATASCRSSSNSSLACMTVFQFCFSSNTTPPPQNQGDEEVRTREREREGWENRWVMLPVTSIAVCALYYMNHHSFRSLQKRQ
jgi:hypothetical protein